jgi:hypothetical protein
MTSFFRFPHSVPSGTVDDNEGLPFSTNIPSLRDGRRRVHQGIADRRFALSAMTGKETRCTTSLQRCPRKGRNVGRKRNIPLLRPSRMGRHFINRR